MQAGPVCLSQVQRDAHVPQLLDCQQRGDDVLAKAVVYQHLQEGRQQGDTRVVEAEDLPFVTESKSLTFHTGSAAVFFGGGALKLSIRFRATVNGEKQMCLNHRKVSPSNS